MENILTRVELERSIPDHAASLSVRPKFYHPQLDCLRFMACYNTPTDAKVLRHLGLRFLAVAILVLDKVGFGLSLFFFLSSYLITSLLTMQRRTSGTINLKSFCVRRILKIWRLHRAFLGSFALVGHRRAARGTYQPSWIRRHESTAGGPVWMAIEASETTPTQQLDPGQPKTTRKTFYRPELDALRFFAFLLVFIFHVSPARFSGRRLAGGITVNSILYPLTHCMADGVCLFFLLSAYLITTLIIRERSVTGTLDLASFYRRRILRIWPLYFCALALAFIAYTAVRGFPGAAPIAAYVLLAGNLNVFHIHVDIRPLKIFHLWSISVEEQFYLMFPMIARSIKLCWLPCVFAAILVVMIATVTYASHLGESRETLWYNSGVQFIMFGAGIMVAYLFSDRPTPRLNYGTRFLMFAAGSGLCFSSEYLFTSRGPVPTIVAYLMVMLGCSVVLVATLGFAGHIPRSLVYLGKISYGLYVFHIWGLSFAAYILSALLKSAAGSPSVAVAKDVFGLALTIAMAAISYRWLETPFLRLKRHFEVVKTRPV